MILVKNSINIDLMDSVTHSTTGKAGSFFQELQHSVISRVLEFFSANSAKVAVLSARLPWTAQGRVEERSWARV
jgi:hypothetical protein